MHGNELQHHSCSLHALWTCALLLPAPPTGPMAGYRFRCAAQVVCSRWLLLPCHPVAPRASEQRRCSAQHSARKRRELPAGPGNDPAEFAVLCATAPSAASLSMGSSVGAALCRATKRAQEVAPTSLPFVVQRPKRMPPCCVERPSRLRAPSKAASGGTTA